MPAKPVNSDRLRYPLNRELLTAALVTYVNVGDIDERILGDFEVLLEELRDDGYLDDEQWKRAMPR